MTTKLAGTFVGAAIALAAGSAFAQPGVWTLKVHKGDFAGTAYPGENRERNNHDVKGTGIEHLRCNYLANAEGGARVMCIGLASYTDIPDSPVTDVNQGLCASFRVDPQMGLVQTALRYVTRNDGHDERNANAPVITPALNGTVAVAYYNYRPNNSNRTKFYGKVLGPNCEELSQQTLLFQLENDDVLGMADNLEVMADSPTASRHAGCGIGNGNGQDDGWCLGINVANNNGTYTLERYFARSVVAEEERTRFVIEKTSRPDTLFYCAAEGNSQPPNRGVRCGLISTDPNTPNDQRVLFRKYIQQREGEIYVSTPTLAPVLNADGTPSDNFIVNYVEVDNRNRRGRYKGPTSVKTLAVHVGPTDVELLETPKYDMVGFGDQAHQYTCGAKWGPNGESVAVEIEGALSGSVTGVGRATVLGYDSTTRKSVTRDALVYADSNDSGWLSSYYGQNPNTPQGRNHAFCMPLANPGYGVAGGFQPDVKDFLFVANTSRNLRMDGTPEDKLAFDVVLIPAVVPAGDEPDPNPDTDPEPEPEPEPEPDPDQSGNQVGGCSTGGASSLGSLALLGLAAAFLRRRRAQ